MQLNKYEREFIENICQLMVIDECERQGVFKIYSSDFDNIGKYTIEAQEVYDELFDRYQTMFFNVVKIPTLESKKPHDDLWEHDKMQKFLNELATFYGMSW
jgi:hypothetical protein|tara:strand:+ start:2018 stop:2320 length:303 start_codon:yes stop_codon:yes gene_type:complete